MRTYDGLALGVDVVLVWRLVSTLRDVDISDNDKGILVGITSDLLHRIDSKVSQGRNGWLVGIGMAERCEGWNVPGIALVGTLVHVDE